MAGRKTGRDSRKFEAAVEAASEAKIGLGEVSAKTNITPNFTYVAYGMKKGYRYIALEGSSRSGKTYAILQWIIYASMNPKMFIGDFKKDRIVTRCLRFDAVNARDSIWADLNEIMDDLGIQSGQAGFAKNETRMQWTFPNGSQIICGSANDPGKLHGLGQDILYFNEVMMIPKAALDQTGFRTRIAYIFDWNPSLNDHWIFKMGFDKTSVYGDDEIRAGKPKCLYAHSTYKDNPYLTDYQIADIEKYEPTPQNIERGTADKWLWEVYGLGKRGFLEGRIIPADKVEFIEVDEKGNGFPTSSQWELHGYGLDWGFQNDETALVECAIWNKKLYVRELVYEKGLLVAPSPSLPNNRCLISVMRGLNIGKTDIIVADNARPESNAALRMEGYTVVAVDKSIPIEEGINIMNQRKWCVLDDCFNTKKELENYIWAQDRYGNTKRKPRDKFNHIIDAIRYWCVTFIDSGNRNRIGGKYDNTDNEVEYACVVDEW